MLVLVLIVVVDYYSSITNRGSMSNRNSTMYRCFLHSIAVLLIQSLPFAMAALDKEDQTSDSSKALKICSIAGGLNIARLVSSDTRNLFRDALEDVELIREYMSEAAYNRGIAGGLHDLDALKETLNWEKRGLSSNETTVTAGLGYSDDRPDRRLERYVGLANEPFVGTKESDMAFIDSASNIFPWIIDRRSRESHWFVSHQNGRSARKHRKFDRLYVAAWMGTRGEAWVYYPPLTTVYPKNQTMGFGDVLGPVYDSQEEEFVKPNLPENNPDRLAHFTAPYADTAVPGLSLITAQAPIYFTGEFRGVTYNDTYIASTGVDISVASMSTLLDELEDTLTEGSFAFLVDVKDFHMVAISQSTVEKIYPRRTGMEDVRVTYNTADGSLLEDRRNVPYKVSDTIHQSPRLLTNAKWEDLAKNVGELAPGNRGSEPLDIVLTGETDPTPYYVMYERWADVADWALVVFAPQIKVDQAVSVYLDRDEIDLEVQEGTSEVVSSTIFNNGTMDVTVCLNKFPPWFSLKSELKDEYHIKAGHSLSLEFETKIEEVSGTATSLIAYTISDHDYPDCFYESVFTTRVSVKVMYEMELNQLDSIRPYGYALAAIVVLSAMICSFWVFRHRELRVVRASQPLFLHVICAGIVVMGLSIIPMGIDDSIASDRGCSVACMAMPWLLSLGFSIVFSALFSKIWRINQVVQACQNFQRIDVKVHHVMVPFFFIFTANVVILTIWTSVDPLVWVRESGKDSRGADEFDSYGFCSFQNHPASLSLGASLLAINFLALVLAIVQLYRARNVPVEYSESKYIAIAIGSNLQVFLTGLPILVLVNDSPQLLYFVKSSLVFVLAMSMLLLIFLPKVFISGKSTSSLRPSNEPESRPGMRAAARADTVSSKDGRGHRTFEAKPSSCMFSSDLDHIKPSEISRPAVDSTRDVHNGASMETKPIPPNNAQMAFFSDITESMAPGHFETSEIDSVTSDDLTLSSYDIWKSKYGKTSQRNAKLPSREPSIPEHDADPSEPEGIDISDNLTEASTQIHRKRLASAGPSKSTQNSSFTSRTADSQSGDSRKTLDTNPNMPRRVPSEVQHDNDEANQCAVSQNVVVPGGFEKTKKAEISNTSRHTLMGNTSRHNPLPSVIEDVGDTESTF